MSTVHEVSIEIGRRFCEIDPGDLFVNNGDSVAFLNRTEGRIKLFFGNPALFDRETVEIDAGARFGPVPVGKNPPRRSFQYVVYSEQTGAFGVGGSNPRIIIMQ